MKDKRIFIIIAALTVLALIIVLAFIVFPASQKNSLPLKTSVYQPEFLTAGEKQVLNLPVEMKVQALKRNGQGGVTIYKVIRNDSEIVSDPSKIGPISPRQK